MFSWIYLFFFAFFFRRLSFVGCHCFIFVQYVPNPDMQPLCTGPRHFRAAQHWGFKTFSSQCWTSRWYVEYLIKKSLTHTHIFLCYISRGHTHRCVHFAALTPVLIVLCLTRLVSIQHVSNTMLFKKDKKHMPIPVPNLSLLSFFKTIPRYVSPSPPQKQKGV